MYSQEERNVNQGVYRCQMNIFLYYSSSERINMTDLTHDLQATGLIMYTAVPSNVHVPIQPSQHHVLLPPNIWAHTPDQKA